MEKNDTIAAVATGTGGAIAVIRISGPGAVALCDGMFESVSGRPLAQAAGYSLHYGYIREEGETVDDVLVSLFRAPHSYTGEDMVEISCHGSRYIQQEILRLSIAGGARMAEAGEFTLRAFLNGKMDLSQAEAVADIIAAENRSALRLAANQMRGGYSAEFAALRERLVELASLLELELDFSEEEVEFADRHQLATLTETIAERIQTLEASFKLGNILKNGVPVAIVGAPNAGKSTLLNTILREEKALVSEIAGTTRDVIEENLNLNGITYRFIDTAGIRETEDRLESMGIERTMVQIGKAAVVLLLADIREDTAAIRSQIDQIDTLVASAETAVALLLNKCDTVDQKEAARKVAFFEKEKIPVFALSAKQGINTECVLSFLRDSVDTGRIGTDDPVVFNARHHEILIRAGESLARAKTGLESGLPGDLLAQDIRETLHYLGLITGEITTDDILGSIFSKFCIGK